MDEKIKEIEEEYNLFKKEIYPPSGSMEVLQDVVIHKFFNERVPYLLSRIEELEIDLKLNASMLAKQTDLARETEIRVRELEDKLTKKLCGSLLCYTEKIQTEFRIKELEEGIKLGWQLSTWVASIKWTDKEKNTEGWLAGLAEKIEKFQEWHKKLVEKE